LVIFFFRRQRKKRPALILKLGLVRLPVCEAFAFHTFDGGKCAINVAIAIAASIGKWNTSILPVKVNGRS
jgi:hypothetical protein